MSVRVLPWLCVAFAALMPLRYYACGSDERFAWRMFSANVLRTRSCDVALHPQVPFATRFQASWREPLAAGDRRITSEALVHLCKDGSERVSIVRVCTVNGERAPVAEVERQCASGKERALP